MNLTWHIVKKDLRAMKWPLGLWLLVIVTRLCIGVAMLTSDGTVSADWFRDWFVRMDIFTKFLAGLECISFILVAAVLHEDLLVGTTSFWMTRPISGARLLGAKFLGLGLMFWVLPVLVTLPWWLFCDYGLNEIGWAALETVAVQLVCVLLGLLWGVVTDGFARFLMWTLVLLFAIPTISGVIGLHYSTLKVKPTPDLVLTRLWVCVALAVLAILVVTVHQFLTRRTWRSIGLLGATAGLAIAVGLWWPVDLQLKTKWEAFKSARAEAAGRGKLSPEPEGVKFSLLPAQLQPRSGVPVERLVTARTKFTVTGIADTQVILPWNGNPTLHWPDGTTDPVTGWVWGGQDVVRRAASKSLGVPLPATDRGGEPGFTSIINVPLATLPRIRAEKPTLTVKGVFRLMKFESAVKFPLQPGARIIRESFGERVAHVETVDTQVLVTYIRSRPDFFLGDRLTNPYPQTGSTYSVYGVVNQAAGKFEAGYRQWWTSSRIASVEISLETKAYGPRPAGRKNLLPEAWLRDAELIRQTFTEEVRFSHELAIGQFPTEVASP